MALTPAQKQAAYRARQKSKLAELQQAAKRATPDDARAAAHKRVNEIRDTLNESQKERFDKALSRAVDALRPSFESQIRAEVESRVSHREKLCAEEEEKYHTEKARYIALIADVTLHMTQDEYRLLLNVTHPDRAPAGMQEKYNKAFTIIKGLEAMVNKAVGLRVLRSRGWYKKFG